MKPTGKPPACEVLLLLHVLTGEAYGDLREHSEHRLRRQPGRRAEGRACACACAGGRGPVASSRQDWSMGQRGLSVSHGAFSLAVSASPCCCLSWWPRDAGFN